MRIVADAGPATPSDPVLSHGLGHQRQDNGGLPSLSWTKWLPRYSRSTRAVRSWQRSRADRYPVGRRFCTRRGRQGPVSYPVSQRTTPAGRYFAKYGFAHRNEQVLWIDYANAGSLHPVITSNARTSAPAAAVSIAGRQPVTGMHQRAEVLLRRRHTPLIQTQGGVAYILPEGRPLEQVFAAAGPARTGRSSCGA